MRILQIGDTHLGMKAPMIGAPRGTDRAADHLAAFDAALRPALEGEVDAVIHTGDLFDRSQPPARAVRDAAERIVAVARRVPVLVIAGNHDRRGLFRYIPHRLPGLHVLDRPSVVQLGALRVAGLPFVRSAEDWSARARELCRPGVDLLVAHQAFDGDQVPGFSFRVDRQQDTVGERHIPERLKWILSGHLHPRQAVRLGDCTMVHGGSTERTAFSEADQTKGWVEWDWGAEPRWRYVDGPARAMVRVREESDLAAVTPGSWVLLPKDAPEDWVVAVRRAGGWIRSRFGGGQPGMGRSRRASSPSTENPWANMGA